MIDKILAGIFTKFTGSTLSTALGARMYSRFVPQSVTFPYAVVHINSADHDWNFSDDFEDVEVQFNAFSNSQGETEITDITNKILSLYDDCTLTITGYTSVYMHRERILSLSDIETGVRQQPIIYNLLIEK